MTASFALAVVEAGGEHLPCIHRGPLNGTPLLVLPPLFEEMNRTRRLIALITARLATRGIRSCLPDLPGTGDHTGGPEAMDWSRWRDALAALSNIVSREVGGAPHLFAVRGGALLADAVTARSLYCLAPPANGGKPLRDLFRARAAADREAGARTNVGMVEALSLAGDTVEAAGYAISPSLAAALRSAPLPAPDIPTRTVATTPGPNVDAVIAGAPVWRQAEPIDVSSMADALADDLAAWIARCDRRG